MDNVVRGGNVLIDTLNLWRALDEMTMPEIKHAMDNFTPGGHHMQVGWQEETEALEATIKTKTADPALQTLIGRLPGDYTTLTWYENLLSFRTGDNRGRVVTMKGLVTGTKQDNVKGHKAAGREYKFGNIVYYLDIFEGRIIHRFDFFSGPGATLVNGVAPYAGMAANLAITGGTVL